MLILKRRRRQRIKVGDAIVTVIGWSPNSVRIGIDAPADVNVVRGELLERTGQQDVGLEPVARIAGGGPARG